MKKLLLNLTLLLSISTGAVCQSKITGEIIAGDGKPIPFASVILLNPGDTTLIKGAMATETGGFEIDRIEPGKYFLRYSAIGYKTLNTPVFEITSSSNSKHVGSQILEESARQLDAVVIKAEKPLYQQELDRTIINVQNSILTKGSSILEVLERSPGVVVDRQNDMITLNGKSGVAVMINGKVMRLPASEITSMLKGMSANNIDKLEIVNAPPSKYDAEGAGGMINIVVKKSEEYGTNGSVSLTAGYGYREKGIVSASINHRNKRANIYGSYSYTHDKGYWAMHNQGQFRFPYDNMLRSFDYNQYTEPVRNIHNATIGVDYYLNKKTTIGASSILADNHEVYTGKNSTEWVLGEDSLIWKIDVWGKSHWKSAINNINVERILGKDEKLNVDFDYLYYKMVNPSYYENTFLDNEGNNTEVPGTNAYEAQRLSNQTPFNIYVYKADYEKRFNPHLKLESGFKSSHSRILNSVALQFLDNGTWINSTNPNAYYNLTMEESISALHSALTMEFDSITINAGLRYEYTKTDLFYDIDAQNDLHRRFGNFFPSVLMSKKFSEDKSIRFSYTKRISRPSYRDIASNITMTDAYAIVLGNAALKPVITHNLQSQYQYKQYLFSVLLSKDVNQIAHFQNTKSPSDSIIQIMPQNLGFQNSLTFQATVPVQVTKWWKMDNNLSWGWRQYETIHLPDNFRKTFFQININASQSFELPNGIHFEVSGFYSLRDYIGVVRRKSLGVINLGLRKELKHNRGTILLSVSDLLKSMHYRIRLDMPQIPYEVRTDVDGMPESRKAQIIKLTYTRSFGRTKEQKRLGNGSADERQRINQY